LIAPLLDRIFERVMERDVANLARVMEAGEL
jgi:hypothetical protein